MDIFLKKRNALIIIFASYLFCGCGYTARSVLPAEERTIYVDNFINKITVTKEVSDSRIYYPYKPGMEIDIMRTVIDRFLFDGNYQIKSNKNAYFILKGQLVDFRREPLRYDADDTVLEYRLSVVVDIELYRREDGSLVWRENNFAGESTYRTTGDSRQTENTALRAAIEDLARRLVERTVENW